MYHMQASWLFQKANKQNHKVLFYWMFSNNQKEYFLQNDGDGESPVKHFALLKWNGGPWRLSCCKHSPHWASPHTPCVASSQQQVNAFIYRKALFYGGGGAGGGVIILLNKKRSSKLWSLLAVFKIAKLIKKTFWKWCKSEEKQRGKVLEVNYS